MSHTDNLITASIRSLKDMVKQAGFPVLQITAQRIAAQIRDLNHTGKLAVNEQWRLNYSCLVCPQCPLLMKPLH